MEQLDSFQPRTRNRLQIRGQPWLGNVAADEVKPRLRTRLTRWIFKTGLKRGAHFGALGPGLATYEARQDEAGQDARD